jgi:hypothetical protein
MAVAQGRLQALVAPLAASAVAPAAPGRLHSELVREEWAKNPSNRAGGGQGFA